MSTSFWANISCPQCKQENWLYTGDPQDMSLPDVLAAKCWNCCHRWWLDEFSEEMADQEETPEQRLINAAEQCKAAPPGYMKLP